MAGPYTFVPSVPPAGLENLDKVVLYALFFHLPRVWIRESSKPFPAPVAVAPIHSESVPIELWAINACLGQCCITGWCFQRSKFLRMQLLMSHVIIPRDSGTCLCDLYKCISAGANVKGDFKGQVTLDLAILWYPLYVDTCICLEVWYKVGCPMWVWFNYSYSQEHCIHTPHFCL